MIDCAGINEKRARREIVIKAIGSKREWRAAVLEFRRRAAREDAPSPLDPVAPAQHAVGNVHGPRSPAPEATAFPPSSPRPTLSVWLKPVEKAWVDSTYIPNFYKGDLPCPPTLDARNR